MAVIPEGFAQVNYRFIGNLLPTGAEVTLGVDHTAFVGTPDEMAESMVDDYVDQVLANMSNQLTLVGAFVKLGPNATGAEGSFTINQAGGATEDPNAPNAALLVKKVTAAGGRANKGRLYNPGLTEAQIDTAGVVDPDVLLALQADWGAFFLQVVASDLTPVVLHSEGSPVSTPTEIISLQVDSRVATQRRRLRR